MPDDAGAEGYIAATLSGMMVRREPLPQGRHDDARHIRGICATR